VLFTWTERTGLIAENLFIKVKQSQVLLFFGTSGSLCSTYKPTENLELDNLFHNNSTVLNTKDNFFLSTVTVLITLELYQCIYNL
jgi:hypothetical protein